jgi:hypothetical protein
MPLGRLDETRRHWLDRRRYSIQAFRSWEAPIKAVFAWIGDVVSARCWSTALYTMCDLRRRRSCTGANMEGTPARLMNTHASIIPRGRHRGPIYSDTREPYPEVECGARQMTTWTDCGRHHSAVGWIAPHNLIDGTSSALD